MFREYFCNRKWGTAAFAYAGGATFVLHSVFNAVLRLRLNDFYAGFYDAVGAASLAVSEGTAAEIEECRSTVYAWLLDFVWIVGPAVVVHPLARYIRSRWVLAWRICLLRAYIRGWREWASEHAAPDSAAVEAPPFQSEGTGKVIMEGAAQRVHEDTSRFSNGMSGVVSTLLDVVATLIAFSGKLIDLGRRIPPPAELAWLQDGTGDAWLFSIALGLACGGLAVSVTVGAPLVGLEVDNQKVEAILRKDLVLMESATAAPESGRLAPGSLLSKKTDSAGSDSASLHLGPRIAKILLLLASNYRRLFSAFLYLNTWLSAFEQGVAILPYFILAPLLFRTSSAGGITLGTLVQVADVFGRVFGALNTLGDSWGAVNDFRSTVRRLLQWEKRLAGEDSDRSTRSLHDTDSRDGKSSGDSMISHRFHNGENVDDSDSSESATSGGAGARDVSPDISVLPQSTGVGSVFAAMTNLAKVFRLKGGRRNGAATELLDSGMGEGGDPDSSDPCKPCDPQADLEHLVLEAVVDNTTQPISRK